MQHLTHISRRKATPAPARSLLVWQAQLEVISAALDVIERILGLIKGAGDEQGG